MIGVRARAAGLRIQRYATVARTPAILAPDAMAPPASTVYPDGAVPVSVKQVYKAAGILPVAREPNTRALWMLLGREMRRRRPVWNDFGGKREDVDKGLPERTAMREFEEETGLRAPFVPGTVPCVWNATGSYLLYLVDVETVPHFPLQLRPSSVKSAVCWLPAAQVVAAARAPPGRVLLQGRALPSADASVTEPAVELFMFFAMTIARLELPN